MRREKKRLARAIYITDMLSRWRKGEWHAEVYEFEANAFKVATEATDSEMTLAALDIEDMIITHVKNMFAVQLVLTRPRLPVLCRKYYEFDLVGPSMHLIISRAEELLALYASHRKFLNDEIVESVRELYLTLKAQGMSYEALAERVWDSVDVRYDDGITVKVWPHINTRLIAMIESWSMAAKGGLQRFVEDAQNVHTAPVNAQTKAMLDLLFAVPVPVQQLTLMEIRTAWLLLDLGSALVKKADGSYYDSLTERYMVIHDMQEWGKKSMITEPGDFLYRRALKHLWAKIKLAPSDLRDELTKRLYEECMDSKYMCAQGHIARLTNVLVGFDAAFKQPVSLGDRMADISRMDITEEEKRMAGILVLQEFAVPLAEQGAWLDAF